MTYTVPGNARERGENVPIIRIDIPEGHARDQKARLQKRIHECIAATWAKEHIYIAITEMFSQPGQEQAIVTVDLRPGRGREAERTRALHEGVAKAFLECLSPPPREFVLLVRQVPAEGFATEGGPLPRLDLITPALG
jgi:phenylpyruvate tautomerase PptA (4-oxalocrotonate tautomerase family)